MDKLEMLANIIDKSKNIVFFTGAGASTESGIPDFRSKKGIFREIEKEYGCSPEVLLSKTYFDNNMEIFFKIYKKHMICEDALPNDLHKSIVELEKKGKVKIIITQNVDGLHQKAGSKNVIELHGSIYKNYCIGCKKRYNIDYIKKSDSIPKCLICGCVVRPDVTLYEEILDMNNLNKALGYIVRADVLIVIGTSLLVYPAADLIKYFSGKNLVIVNKSSNFRNSNVSLEINMGAGEVFKNVIELIN